jgi:hypothetical protein
LLPQRKQVVNSYLISVDGDDPDAKEKIGEVVAVPYPAQVDREGVPISDIYKKIHSAIFGDMSKKIGAKALDLSEKGRSLIIKVTEKAGYNNYSETAFDDAEDLGLSPSQIKEILNKAHDLSEFIPEVKSQDEIQKILDKHWFGTSATPDDELEEEEVEVVSPKRKINLTTKLEDDEIPMGKSKSDDLDDLDDLLSED